MSGCFPTDVEPKFGKWISVDDDLPELEQYVLVYGNKRASQAMRIDWYSYTCKKWMIHADNTHWMPLPSPPE